MSKRIMALILVALLLTGCASQAGTNTASNKGGTISISDFESELESTSSSVTSEPEAESKPITSAEVTTKPAETTTKPVEVTEKPAETTTKKPVESKPETTSAPATTKVSTTTASTTKPAPEWTETKVSGTKYVNTDCYSRKKAVLGAETVKLYSVNDKVKVVAKTNTGYFKLDTGAFIHGDYLSDSKIVIQTTVATTTKKQESPKPATTTTTKKQETPKPSASADPVDEVYYANNAPAIDEEWLAKKFPEYVRVKDTYPSSPDDVPATADNRSWGTGIWLDKTVTVGKDIPEGWYLCQRSCIYVPAMETTYYTRSNGYTSGDIMGQAHYFKSGDKIYCNNITDTGEKVSKLAYLMPISNGYTDAGQVYYKGKVNAPKFTAVVGKGNKYEPGKYKVKFIEEFDTDFNQYLCYASLYSAVYDKMYACDGLTKDGAIITLTAGDVVTGYDVELIKVS